MPVYRILTRPSAEPCGQFSTSFVLSSAHRRNAYVQIIDIMHLIMPTTHADGRRVVSFPRGFVCLSCLSVFRRISWQPMQPGSQNLTQKCCTTSPKNPFILGSKGQKLRSKDQKQCRRALWHSCACWLLLVNFWFHSLCSKDTQIIVY